MYASEGGDSTTNEETWENITPRRKLLGEHASWEKVPGRAWLLGEYDSWYNKFLGAKFLLRLIIWSF